jgi:flagellar basal-body rod modification protein FlgD
MIPGLSPNSDVRYSTLETGMQIEYSSAKKVLNQDDFLKLLITQFSTQDPLNPVTDTAFISQMAEFASLENAKETQSEISLIRQQSANQEAISMIGKEVELLSGDDGVVSGKVSKVLIDSDGPKLVVDGYPYALEKVVAVKDSLNISEEPLKNGSSD